MFTGVVLIMLHYFVTFGKEDMFHVAFVFVGLSVSRITQKVVGEY